MKIWTDDEYIEVDPNDVGELEAAMLFKAKHIKSKADPELFAAVAEMLSSLCDSATKRVDVVRCRECIWARVADNDREPKYRCVHLIRYGCKKWLYSNDFCSYGERKEGTKND